MPSSLYAVVASADASRTSGNAARRGGPHDAIHFYVAHPSAGHRKRRLATREWGSQAYRSKQPFRLGLKSLCENPDLHSLGIVPEWLRRRPNILGRSLRANCLWASHLRGFKSPDSCWRIAERVEAVP